MNSAIAAHPSSSHAMTPAAWLSGLLTALGSRRQGRKWQCPHHGLTDGHTAALTVGDRLDGTGAWVYCHAGCRFDDILRALHLTPTDLRNPPPVTPAAHAATLRITFPPPKATASGSLGDRGFRFESEHPYATAHDPRTTVAWKLRYRHRSGAKEIRWESLNHAGERVLGLLARKQADLGLYRWADCQMGAAAGETIHLVESESSVDALTRAGLYATCWPGGAGDPPENQIRELLAPLGNQVVVIPDNDDAGIACARKLHRWLPQAQLLLGNPGEDARDVLARLGPAGFHRTFRSAA